MQLLQHVQFVVGAQAAARFINPQLGRHTVDHRGGIARQQQRAPAAGLAGRQQRRGVGAQAVIEDKPGQRPLSVPQQQPLAGLLRHVRHGRPAQFTDKPRLADAQALRADAPFETQAGRAVHFLCGVGRATESAGNRVFGAIFQRSGQPQAVVAVQITQGANGPQRQTAFGQGAGFVENHGVDLVQAFDHVPACQQQAQLMQRAGGRRERGGGRQREGARAGCYQHGQHNPERTGRVQLPPHHADGGRREQREQQKPLRGLVGYFRQARFFALGAVEQAHDSRQARVLAQSQHFNGQGAFDVQRARRDRVAGAAGLWQVFAGQQ